MLLLFFYQIEAWLLALGFTTLFGALFSKTYRVYVIFRNYQIQRKVCQCCCCDILKHSITLLQKVYLIHQMNDWPFYWKLSQTFEWLFNCIKYKTKPFRQTLVTVSLAMFVLTFNSFLRVISQILVANRVFIELFVYVFKRFIFLFSIFEIFISLASYVFFLLLTYLYWFRGPLFTQWKRQKFFWIKRWTFDICLIFKYNFNASL